MTPDLYGIPFFKVIPLPAQEEPKFIVVIPKK
jgi:hypothetical protein